MNIIETGYNKHIDKIVHIADIHIRPYKRHGEYKKVFINLYNSIVDNITDNSIIVLVGDIVHAKTEMTPELISMLSDLFIKLETICPVILVPGNHDCFTGEHEILTKEGWVRLDEYINSDNNDGVATFNLSNKEIEFERPLYKINKKYKGEMYHFNGKDAEFICTPNHRIFYKAGNPKMGEKIYEKEAKYLKQRKKINIPLNGIILNKKINFLGRLAGLAYADATFVKKYFNKENKLICRVQFHLKKHREINFLIKTLSMLNIDVDEKKYWKNDSWKYNIYGELALKLFEIFETHKTLDKFTGLNKNIPWSILNNNKNFLSSFLLGYLNGDGGNKKNYWGFNSINKQSIEVLATISRLVGARSRTYFNKINYGNYKNSKRLYGGSCTINDLINSTHCNFNKNIEFDGNVYCLTTTNTTLLIRYNDKIFISGNCNLNNMNRMDALTPIVNNLNLNNLYYWKYSGVYKFGNIYFSHMSVFDSEENYIKASDISELNPKIALYHGIVDKSTNNFGYNLRNDKISTALFDGYDYVLLGDIHKHQYLKSNIAYPSSLIQQNHGESLNHGYILWDLEKKTSKFIKVENDFGYYTLEIKNNIIPDVNDMPKRCRLRIQAYDIPSSDLNDIIIKIKKQYNPAEITINRINSTLSNALGNKLEIPNVGDINYQNNLIEHYLNQNTTTSKEYIDIIRDINIHTNSKIEIKDIIKNIRWSPITFEWSNMFSYGENNIIDFTDMKGVIGLFSPNATGKSAAVDSLSFCLFDKASRDFKPINIMNNKRNTFDCKIKFLMSDKIYSIHKHVWKNKRGGPMYKSSFSVIDENGKSISLNGDSRWETNKNIYSRIGTFEDFILTSFSMQGNNSNYTDKGHSERKDLIIQFIGLGIFDRLYDKAAEELKEISSILKNLISEDWDDKLINSQKQQKEYNKEYNKLLKEKNRLDNFIKLNNKNITELLEQLINIDEDINIDKLNENLNISKTSAENIKLNLNKIRELYDINKNEIKEIKKQIDVYDKLNINKMYEDYSDLLLEQKDFDAKINNLKVIIDNKNDKMKKLKELEYDPDCNYCMNNIFVKDAINTRNELKIDTEQFNELKHNRELLCEIIDTQKYIKTEFEKYNKLMKALSTLEVNKHKLALNKSQQQRELDHIETQIEEILKQINKYDYFRASIENNSRINNLIVNIQGDIDTQEKILKDVDGSILKIYSKIEIEKSNQKIYTENITLLNDNSKKQDCYKLYLETIKRDGIPYDIISEVIPSIEVEINNILNQIVDFSIIINLDDSKNINIYIVYDEDNYWPLELSSGMERFLSSIAIRVALTNISNLPRPNFLIIDEGWGSLDSENLNSVSMLLDYLKTQFDFILLISHIDQIRDVADKLIEIKLENNFSYINHTE